jgi:protein SCO1
LARANIRAQRSIVAPTVSGSSVWDNRGMGNQAKWVSICIVCVMAAAGAAAALLWRHEQALPELSTGTLLVPSRAFGDFNLIDTQGRTFASSQLRGRWSILFFGYTNCPDVCPATLSMLAALEKQLRAQAGAVLPQVVFVSVDAKRDTPAQLAKYVPYFDPSFIGLTAADQPGIEAVAKELGVAVIITPTQDGNYTVDHSGELFVLDPNGRLAALLSGPFTLQALAADWRRITSGPA